ncbi:adenosylmethionine decarboxylase [Xenophilus sp. Marseille-Q4582]|uniref:adenosylmethionine decarboxylase n=1 Tax=Xenophilus sp. Marseille-Q4582 TaxID=2866600 RepID=UPI001CE4002C|nr:adenosylmethionine decarboxylase [Xenophilus sp. Marseille-Q4582]
MHGLHLTADLYDCQCAPPLLVSEAALAPLCRTHTQAAGLTVVGEKWFSFPSQNGRPGGVTGTLLLAESHLAVHTWPELGHVTLDVYVCNYAADNTQRAEQLMHALVAAFAPQRRQVNRLLRGALDASATAPR